MFSDPVNIVLAALLISALIVGSLIVFDPILWREKKAKRNQSAAQRAASKPGIVIDTGQAPRSQYGNRITESEKQAALKSIRDARKELQDD